MKKIYIPKTKILELAKLLKERYKNSKMKISINKKTFTLNIDRNLKYEEFKELELLIKRFFPDYDVRINKS
jgi:hypothetical protein